MRVNVLYNTNVNIQQNKIYNLIIYKVSISVIVRPVIILKIWNICVCVCVCVSIRCNIKYA